MKKKLAALLCAAMLACALPALAWADEAAEPTADQATAQESAAARSIGPWQESASNEDGSCVLSGEARASSFAVIATSETADDALDGMPSEDYVEPTYAIENANRFDDEAFGSDAPGLLFVYDVNENGAVVRYYYDDGTPIESLTHNETTWYQQIALRGGLIEVLDINTAAYYDLETMDLVFETYLGYEAD